MNGGICSGSWQAKLPVLPSLAEKLPEIETVAKACMRWSMSAVAIVSHFLPFFLMQQSTGHVEV